MHILPAHSAIGRRPFVSLILKLCLSTGGTMGEPSEEIAAVNNSHPVPAVPNGGFILWSVLAALALVLAVGAVVVRVLAGPRFDGFLILARSEEHTSELQSLRHLV